MNVLTEKILAEAISDKASANMMLPLYVGRTSCNENVFVNLSLQPHLLLGGDSGSGKTNCLNVIICGLASRFRPSQMKLILMDTACIEFYDYKAIPHLARPVLNKITDCAETLRWLSQELDNRLVEIMRAGHRDAAFVRGREEETVEEALDTAARLRIVERGISRRRVSGRRACRRSSGRPCPWRASSPGPRRSRRRPSCRP